MSRKQLIEDDASQYDSINQRLRRLEQGIPEDAHFVGATGEPTFQNAWVNYDSGLAVPAPPSRDVGFYRHQGRVYLTGVIKSGISNATIFTLPSQYRYAILGSLDFIVSASSGSTAASGAFAFASILADGQVKVFDSSASVVSTFCFLEGVSFRHA